MKDPLLVHPLVQPIVGCFQRCPHLFETQCIGTWGKRIDIGDRPFDLFEHAAGMFHGKERLVSNQ